MNDWQLYELYTSIPLREIGKLSRIFLVYNDSFAVDGNWCW